MGATSLERHHQVALITLLERPNQSDREKSLAVSSLGDAKTSPERHSEVAPAGSDVMGATGRSRSRFHHPETPPQPTNNPTQFIPNLQKPRNINVEIQTK
ncbi:hypothetical protein YC2023_012717 [Brassica napus]